MAARQWRFLASFLLVAVSAAVLPNMASAVPLRAVGQDSAGNDFILRFDSATPGTVEAQALSVSGTDLVGIDYRPVNGALYGVGKNDFLYRIFNTESTFPSASPVGGTSFLGGLDEADSVGFDFNPVSDLGRVVNEDDQNLRVNPNDGLTVDGDSGTPGTQADTPLQYAASDPNAGDDPNVGGSAYNNNGVSATSTTLYGIDYGQDVLVTQDPPNAGTLHTVGSLGINAGANNGFDIPPGSSVGYLVSDDNLYSVNLATGQATLIGAVDVSFDTTTVTIRGLAGPPPQDLNISEFRTRGGNAGADDEFVEVYNPNDFAFEVPYGEDAVAGAGTSFGFGVARSDGQRLFYIPQSTIIAARGHYLGCRSPGYGLFTYSSSCDASFEDPGSGPLNLGTNQGVAIFRSTDPAAFTLANRMDAAGFVGEANAIYKEGAGIPNVSTITTNEWSLVRDYDTGVSGDSNDNAQDFNLVSEGTSAPTASPLITRLGAPGPERTFSQTQRNTKIGVALLDPGASPSAPPNREYNSTPDSDPNTRDSQGNLELRRTLTNNSTQRFLVYQMRFRAFPITSAPSPAGTADLRMLDDADKTVNLSGGGTAAVEDADLEHPSPMDQPEGGGLNSNFFENECTAPDSAGIAGDDTCYWDPGESMNWTFRFGVEQRGAFKVRLHLEVTDG